MGKFKRKEGKSSLRLGALYAAMLVGGMSGVSQAALVQVSGNTVNFIYDDAQGGVSLFGSPSVVGDSLVFAPTTFNAESADGVGVHSGTATDTSTSGFSFRVVAKSIATTIDGVNSTENGSYTLSGAGSLVDSDATMKVSDFNDPVFGAFDTGLLAVSDLTLASGAPEAWNANGGVDLTTALWNGVNDIEVVLTNLLTAQSTAGAAGLAYIDKSSITIDITTTAAVPVPGALWLFGSAILGFAGMKAKKSKKAENFS